MEKPNRELSGKINKAAKLINEQLGLKFSKIDHRDVLREMADNPVLLEKFQLQCLSLSAFAMAGKVDDLSMAFSKSAVGSAQLIATIRASDDIVKGN